MELKSVAMAGKPFEKEYGVHIYETGIDGKLRIDSLMHYFEELALLQSEAEGVGLDYYRKHEVIWLLHGFDIRLISPPAFHERILVQTLPSSVYRFMGYRNYRVMGSDGMELATAKSSWIFIDTRKKRPLRVDDNMKKAYGHDGAPELRMPMEEIPLPSRADYSARFRVLNSNIDINRHVNNVVYVKWAMESLPPSLFETHRINRLQVNWLKETFAGSKVEVQTGLDQKDKSVHGLHTIIGDDGQEKCRLATHWQPR